ncbi:MAG: ABC transporter permease, partial [Thermoanaerobaculia bacterium]
MRPGFFLAAILRESRGSRFRLAFFVACLAVGVAAIVAVAGHSAALDQAIRRESRTLLAADLAISSYRPLPQGVAAALAGRDDLELATLRELPTTVAAPPRAGAPGTSRLVEVKAVDGGYPFYGRLALEPDRPLAELLAPGSVVVAPDLLARLDLAVGDELVLGGVSFTIAGVVTGEPDRIADAFTLGPRVL